MLDDLVAFVNELGDDVLALHAVDGDEQRGIGVVAAHFQSGLDLTGYIAVDGLEGGTVNL